MNMPDINKARHGTDLFREDLIKYHAIPNHKPVSTFLRDLFHKAMKKYPFSAEQKVELDRQLIEASRKRTEKALLRKRLMSKVLTVDTHPIPAKVRKSAKFISLESLPQSTPKRNRKAK